LSRVSEDWHTVQVQPIIGMPWEVPVPRNLTFMGPMAYSVKALT